MNVFDPQCYTCGKPQSAHNSRSTQDQGIVLDCPAGAVNPHASAVSIAEPGPTLRAETIEQTTARLADAVSAAL